MKKGWLIFLALVVLIAACGKSDDEISRCQGIKVDSDKDLCFKSVAEYRQDISACGMIEDTKAEGECQLAVARAKRDVTMCSSIAHLDSKDLCYLSLNLQHDTAVCEKIYSSAWKSSCYYNVAVKNNDSSICGKILDGDRRDACVKAVG